MSETAAAGLGDVAGLREAVYENFCKHPSDINEHLPVLRRLASECKHVTEMGMRTGVSTVALLAAQPETLISWDINPASVVSQQTRDLIAIAGKTRFQPRVGDTREINIEPTDMLFIDTLHTYEQLKDELWRHVLKEHFVTKKVRRYLVFHDTSTFGFTGEDGKQPGILGAIRWFQQNAFPVWGMVEHHVNNNGLLVLRHA